jgi:cell division protein FtsL
MSRRQLMMVLTLGLLVLMSAVGVVYAKYASRRHFVELQGLLAQRDQIEVQWGRLQLEQSTWATNVRVDSTARKKLDMYIPPADQVMVIRP